MHNDPTVVTEEQGAAAGEGHSPEISVVVPSHDRPLRLRWLLNALEEQTLGRDRFEVIVAHDSTGPETEELLRGHPLTRDGVLRHVTFEPSTGSANKLRNAGWRAARAPVIAFTDDDCRPPEDWLENALAAATANAGAIVQGETRGDPLEYANRSAPYPRSQLVLPPQPWAQMCNILYPRELLERVGGLLEDPPLLAGEDTELAVRAQDAGAPYVGAPEVLTYHAIYGLFLHQHLRSLWRWGDLAYLVKLHPRTRDYFQLWIFWKRTHVWLPLALLGLAKRRNPLWLAAMIPWIVHTSPQRATDYRGQFRNYAELPGRFVIDVTEFLALIRGSIKHRSLFL
jgi:glycosyltransferase involved in cell wall biosynthesis